MGTYVGITGGSKGLGREIVKILLQKGADVVIFDREEPDFTFDSNLLTFVKVDLLLEPIPFIASYKFDIFISNAGSYYGPEKISKTPLKEAEKMIKLNVSVPVELFISVDCDLHVFINSVTSQAGISQLGLYCACKAFIKTLNDAIRRERGQTLIVYPFKIDTELFKSLNDRWVLKKEEVAKEIIKGIEQNKKEVFLPGYYRFVPLLMELLPLRAKDYLVEKMAGIFRREAIHDVSV